MSDLQPSIPGDTGEVGAERDRRSGLRRFLVDTTALRASPEFRRLWFGQGVSYILGEVTYVALPYQVYTLTKSTFAVGAIALVELVPLLSLTFIGGAAADALDRRKLLIFTEAGTTLSVAGLVVNAALPHPSVGACYGLAFFAAAFSSLGVGASRSLIPRLVPPEHVTGALALNSLYANLGSVAAPALAGGLIKAVGVTGAYAVGIVGFTSSLIAFWLLPSIIPVGGGEPPGLRSLIDGFRFLGRQRVILGCFLIDTVAMVFGMPSALFPAIALVRLDAGPAVVGYLYAAPAAGALLAALFSGWLDHIRRQGVAIVAAATMWGVAIALFGVATTLWLALVLLGVAGAADAISAVLRNRIMFALTPDAYQGRVSAAYLAQVTSAPRLGNLEAGALASLTSLRFSIVSGGIACVAGCLLLVAAIPSLIRYEAKPGR